MSSKKWWNRWVCILGILVIHSKCRRFIIIQIVCPVSSWCRHQWSRWFGKCRGASRVCQCKLLLALPSDWETLWANWLEMVPFKTWDCKALRTLHERRLWPCCIRATKTEPQRPQEPTRLGIKCLSFKLTQIPRPIAYTSRLSILSILRI